MPAVNDDPAAPVIRRASPRSPNNNTADPNNNNNSTNDSTLHLPTTVFPKQVTLRDRVTAATLVPYSSFSDVPRSLLAYLCDQMNKEIEKGDTYPMLDPLSLDAFGPYWFSNFGAVMLLGNVSTPQDVFALERAGSDWGKVCVGSFNIKPNYPGRSSHVCNGAFLVTDASRNRGVGRLMGECYLEWAPQLGYTYSVFNLVYETNVASCRIWDALGFKRIGRVPGCGNLRSYPGQLVDAIIYGRDLGHEGEDYVSEERFDKIRYYLKHSKYPTGADRAEKSRLRSAATHYKLVGGTDGEPEKLMLKDKEVVSDPQQQYEIARQVHLQQHGGINKTTATIALKYHWVRIKETVSMVIKNCQQCKDAPKPSPAPASDGQQPLSREKSPAPKDGALDLSPSGFETPSDQQQLSNNVPQYSKEEDPFAGSQSPIMHDSVESMADYTDLPLDPQIMDDIQHHLSPFQHHDGMDAYVTNSLHETHGLSSFEHPNMSHHHHERADEYQYVPGDEEDAMDSQAASALRDQTMHLVDTSRLHSDTLHRQLLTASFYDREDQSHFGS